MLETYRGVAHPWLCDIMGHMTTRHYVAMFDDASYHLAHACGIKLQEGSSQGFVDAELKMNYHAEVRAGSLLLIKSGVVQVGNKSFTARHKMYEVESGVHVATMDSVSVAFDLVERKSIPLPDCVREKSKPFIWPE